MKSNVTGKDAGFLGKVINRYIFVLNLYHERVRGNVPVTRVKLA